MTCLHDIAKVMGGEVRGAYAIFPTPGHSKNDRGSTAQLLEGAPDGVLIRSYNGGDPIKIKETLRRASVLPERESWKCTGVYEFRDEDNRLLYQTERLEHPHKSKRYVARLPGGSMKLGNVRRVLYRLPELLASDPTEIVYLVEGERKADKLAGWGMVATAFAFGAKGWRKDYAHHLIGRRVLLLPDNDEEGRTMAEHAARDITAAGGIVRTVALPGLPPKGDIIEWNGTRVDLSALALAAFRIPEPPVSASPNGPELAKLPSEQSVPNANKLFDDITDFLGRFIAYPSEYCRVAHTLWIAHTHLMDAWESTPRLAFLSPEAASGKSRCLELTELLVPRPIEAVNVSPAYLFRKVACEAGLPTILFDEIDTVFGPKARGNEELRGLLNAGHRRGAVAGRCVVRGKEVLTEELPAYCAVALAGLGGLPDTILTRSIVVRMRRRAPTETVLPFRHREYASEGNALRDGLAAWASHVLDKMKIARPELPQSIVNRDADVWEPLLAIADAVGGQWPSRARRSAVALVAASRENPPSLGVKLLTDLQEVFNKHGDKTSLTTELILCALHSIEESPWGDLKGKPLDARGLARKMAAYGVMPSNLRTGKSVQKGYRKEDLYDAWQRYLPQSSSPRDESATAATDEAVCPRCDNEGCRWCEVGK